MQSFLVALAFLTIVPIRFGQLPAEDVVARSRLWYPIVGLLLGAALGLLAALLAPVPMVGAFLLLVVSVGLTGGLHVDGFCDLCDGLFGGSTPEERLLILKEPYLGAFGLIGGTLLLLGKFVGLYELLSRGANQAPWLIAAAVMTARCLVVSMAAGARYPRSAGTGKVLIEATSRGEGIWFLVYAACAVTALASSFDPAKRAALFVAVLLALTGLRRLCEQRLGGLTGDCLGAGIETVELVFLLGAALLTAHG